MRASRSRAAPPVYRRYIDYRISFERDTANLFTVPLLITVSDFFWSPDNALSEHNILSRFPNG
jgi:hypothetical protein